MKILLDECIDRRFAREFVEYEVKTVPQMKWASIKNGDLMKLAEAEFDVFVTVDRNLSFQQNLSEFDLAVVVLRARSNRLPDLQPFAKKIIEAMPNLEKGKATIISLDS